VATLADVGARLGLTKSAARGALLLRGKRSGMAGGAVGGRLAVEVRAQRSSVDIRVDRAALRFAMPLARVGCGQALNGGRLDIRIGARRSNVVVTGRHGRRIVVGWPARRVGVAALRAVVGPGAGGGDVVMPLPGVWLDQAWPDDFIGRDLAALAILRGEPAAMAGNWLVVAGRTLIGEGGAEIWFADDIEAGAWVADRIAEQAGYLGIIGLPAGWRENEIARYRQRAASAVVKLARAAEKIAVGPRKTALLADLNWIQRRI